MRLGLHKLVRAVDKAFYQPIILLYRRVFIRDEKNLVNGLVGHKVLLRNLILADRCYHQSRQINNLPLQVYLL